MNRSRSVVALFFVILAAAAAVLTGQRLLVALAAGAEQDVAFQPARQDTQLSIHIWEKLPLPEGVETLNVTSLIVHPQNSRELYLVAIGKLYHSLDAGDTWSEVTIPDYTRSSFLGIAPSSPFIRYLTASGSFYRSEDAGLSWEIRSTPPCVSNLNISSSDPDRIYGFACQYEPAGLIASQDGGQTWVTYTLPFNYINGLAVHPVNPDILIISSWDEVFRSQDGGRHWTAAATGTRYNSHPFFEPVSPYTLYLGHWRGLLRSTDNGVTWEDSQVNAEFTTLLVSPWEPNTILAAGLEGTWRLSMDENNWHLASWEMPSKVSFLIRSPGDSQAVFACAEGEYWRYVAESLTGHMVFLPSIAQTKQEPVYPLTAVQAIDRANIYRQMVGAIPLQPDPAIIQAAQNHVNYTLLNNGDNSAWINGPHGEVDGKPAFTGIWPVDRIKTAGFTGWGGGEVIHYLNDPVAAVDGWMSTIYHRVITLSPGSNTAGFGTGANNRTRVDVLDFGSIILYQGIWSPAQPYPLGYPADGQTGVPASWNGAETPNPLPAGASTPVGYPFTLQGVNGKLNITSAQLRTATGAVIPVHPNPPDCPAFNCYALIPISPLQKGTAYMIEASGDVDGYPFHRTWSFTTAP